jgi:hypothetical protein
MIMDRKEIEDLINYWEQEKSNIEEKLDDLQSQLESEQPELRHGDYGYGENNQPRLTLLSQDDELFSAGKGCCMETTSNKLHPTIILGNIFDDLQVMAEPLEEFEVIDGRQKVRLKICSNNTIQIYIWGGEIAEYKIEKIEEIHRNLGRLIAEAKRRKS